MEATANTLTDIEARYQNAKERLAALEIKTDEDYVEACRLAQAIKATEKEIEETEEFQEAKRLYAEWKSYSAPKGKVEKKLKEILGITRAHIAAYVVRKGKERLDDQAEKAINAALKTGDDSLLDAIMPSNVELPEVDGVQFAEVKDFEITDPEALPSKYLQPDTKAIRKVVQGLGTDAEIPGVRVYTKTQVRITGA